MKKQLLTTIVLIVAVFLSPLTIRAATATELAATINAFTGGGSGSLIATANGNSVTVTGTLTDVTTELLLDIDEDVNIVWQATISTGISYIGGLNALINLTGSGIFNVATGGSMLVSKDDEIAIYSNSAVIITVSGTGKVEAINNYCAAILSYGNVEIKDDAQVNAPLGYAIWMYGENSTVTVSGGTVTGRGNYVINLGNENNIESNVTISGTGKVEATGDYGIAISSGGNIEIKDNAQVSATTGIAIHAYNENSTITISGTGKVEATVDNGIAINTLGNVEVKENAQVSATTSVAINANGENSTVTVSGGTVSATTGTAISAYGENSTVTVSGGTVTSGGNNVIYLGNSNNTGLNVTVIETGKVEATGNYAYAIAIYTNGSVEVKDDAQVSSTTGTAISAYGENSTVTVSGGEVSSVSLQAIVTIGENSLITVNGTGKAYGSVAINTGGNVVVSGEGEVSTTSGQAIGAVGNVVVGEMGKVQATNDNGIAIFAHGNIEIKDDAQVSATTGTAISTGSESSVVTVSGGTVTGGGSNVIIMNNGNNTGLNVIVSGTGKIEATGHWGAAISTYGSVEVKDNAQVSATTGEALNVPNENSKVTVGGTSKVQTTGVGGWPIYTTGSVEIKDEAHVSATEGIAIRTSGENSVVTISGGEVSATEGATILILGENSTLTISGGLVSNTAPWGYSVINMDNANNTGLNITICGTGKVEATGGGAAISTYGNVEVKDDAQVSSTARAAIIANGTNSTVSVSGGLVFSYGDAVTGYDNVIYLPSNPSGFTEATGTGVVIAWDQAAGNTTYAQGGSDDISWSPASATAVWGKDGASYGISYNNGTNTGFIPLNTDLYFVDVPPASLGFSNSGGQKTFTITSNTTWTVGSNVPWVMVSPASGTGNGTVTVTVLTNTSAYSRSATITVSGSGVAAQTIAVTQDAAPSVATVLALSTNSLSFAASGEQQTFTLASNTTWTVTGSDSWITISHDSGVNDATITLTADANTETKSRKATITVSGTGVSSQVINVTQEASEIPLIVMEETQVVGEDGKGIIKLSLSIPSDATSTGSYDIRFPEGIALNEKSTTLSPELSGDFTLLFTYKGNNTWMVEIKEKALRSSTAFEYIKIMDIAYTADESVEKGTYEATITNLDFLLDDGTVIKKDLFTVPVKVERSATSIENIGNKMFYAYSIDHSLGIESANAELISIYSLTGVPLYSVSKNAGLIEIPFASLPGSVFIIRGSISGTIKFVK